MLSKDSIKVLKFLNTCESFYFKENVLPKKLSKIKHLPDIFNDLVSQGYAKEIGAKTIPSHNYGSFKTPHLDIKTNNYCITPYGVAYLESLSKEMRRTWIPVITSNVIAGLALVISIIALIKSW